jgi:hypothetical protein
LPIIGVVVGVFFVGIFGYSILKKAKAKKLLKMEEAEESKFLKNKDSGNGGTEGGTEGGAEQGSSGEEQEVYIDHAENTSNEPTSQNVVHEQREAAPTRQQPTRRSSNDDDDDDRGGSTATGF